MKITLFTIKNILACHYALFGYAETLQRMGHEVFQYSFPSNQVDPMAVRGIREHMPKIEKMNECDLVLSTYHEYVQPWLAAVYGEEWKKLKVPVVARFDESMDRMDLQLPQRVPGLKQWAQYFSFPAAQDAEKFGGEWHPYGADGTIFKPQQLERKYPIAFIGTLYPQRQAYLSALAPHITRRVMFHVGNVKAEDLSGILEHESTELLAKNYAQCGIFLVLPPLSRLIVEKTFDIMACDTFVMYPRLFGEAEKNLSLFKDGEHIVYYDIGSFVDNGKQIMHYFDHPEERARIGKAGGELVRSKYTLEHLLEELIAMPLRHS